jgi:hypothetical protein
MVAAFGIKKRKKKMIKKIKVGKRKKKENKIRVKMSI